MTPTEATKKITCKDGDCTVIELFQPVHKYSRCGFDGKLIKCPECEGTQRVYHLRSQAVKCSTCKAYVDKYDWMIENEIE